jgi:hypothetical protein
MAEKVVKKKRAAPTTPGADDLQILHPTLTATIAGREITVREYGFVEGLRVYALEQPLLDALYAHCKDGLPELEEILGILAVHHEQLVPLMAMAADVEPDWIAGLSRADGHTLMLLWWTANAPFYVPRVFNRMLAEKAAAAARAGQISTQSSSPADTATSTASDG